MRPEPPGLDEHEALKKKLRDLCVETDEMAHGPLMGAALLLEHHEHPEAARFLMGLQAGMQRVTSRLKAALDEDELPF